VIMPLEASGREQACGTFGPSDLRHSPDGGAWHARCTIRQDSSRNDGGHLTILALVVVALAPSLIALVAGIGLAGFRLARERAAAGRLAHAAGDQPLGRKAKA
jgi:hypothetical protein